MQAPTTETFDTSFELPPHAGQPILQSGESLDNAKLAMVLLHGRGAGPEDVLTLADAYGLEGLAYIAPAAADHSWYPYPFGSGEKSNAPSVESAHTVLESVLSTLARHGFPPERVVLGGFSQGACLALSHTTAYPRRYGRIVAYSGALIGNFKKGFVPHGDLEGTPIEISGGDHDPHVPWFQMQFAAQTLEAMGAEVELHQHAGLPHTVCRDQIAATRERLAAMIAASG